MSEEITNAFMAVLKKQADSMFILEDMDIMTLPFRREAITTFGMEKITTSGIMVLFTNMRKPHEKAQNFVVGCQYKDKYGRLWTHSLRWDVHSIRRLGERLQKRSRIRRYFCCAVAQGPRSGKGD